MSVHHVVDVLHGAGLSLALTPEQALKVTPASKLTTELRDLIRASKSELIDLLARMKAANDDATPWRVTVAPGTPPDALARMRAASLALDKVQAATPPDTPDASCWPHSTAMNGAELDTFTARLARFTDRGLILSEAERLADVLVQRDRECDDRRVCLECLHLQRGRCGNCQVAGVAIRSHDAQLPPDLILQLQRCDGFATATPGATPDSITKTPF